MEKSSEQKEPVKMDALKIYGFSFDFPFSDRIEFNPKFKREAGDVAVKTPARSVVFVSWGELDKAVKKLPTPAEHASFSIEKLVKSIRGKMSNIEQKQVPINGHSAVYNHVKVEASKGAFGGRQEQEIESLHIHCENTSRYFVVYATYNPNNPASTPQQETIKTIMESFKCH